MATPTYKVNVSLSYADGTSRTVPFDNVSADQIPHIATRAKAINDNMSDAFKTTFRSDDNAQVVAIGKLQSVAVEEEVIYSAN